MADGIVQILIIGLIAVASATVVITLYHCIPNNRYTAMWRSRQISLPPPEMVVSLDNSVAELLPAHKYEKGVGLIGLDDGTCAICLGEFEEGEELRTLPECVHSFHVVCIDMWLFSHSNCPMCRTFVGAAELPLRTLMHLLHPSNAAYSTNLAAT